MGGKTSGLLELGDNVTWEAKHFGRRWRMTSTITELRRPEFFVDEMVRGPFASWRHSHEFLGCGASTRMIDRVEYNPGLGLLGRAFDNLILASYLRRYLTNRAKWIRWKAEAHAEES